MVNGGLIWLPDSLATAPPGHTRPPVVYTARRSTWPLRTANAAIDAIPPNTAQGSRQLNTGYAIAPLLLPDHGTGAVYRRTTIGLEFARSVRVHIRTAEILPAACLSVAYGATACERMTPSPAADRLPVRKGSTAGLIFSQVTRLIIGTDTVLSLSTASTATRQDPAIARLPME